METQLFAQNYMDSYNAGNQMSMTTEYYHDDVESIESIPWWSTTTLVDKMKRNERYFSLNENMKTRMHMLSISGRFFSVKYEMTANDSWDWSDITFEEIWVFELKDWKICKEWFFYDPPANLA